MQAAVPIIGLMAVGGMGLSAIGQIRAAKEQAYQLKMETKEDEIATLSREADRKYELNKVLASQIAAGGAGGYLPTSGSPLAILQEDMRLEAKDTQRDLYEYNIRKRVRRMQGRNVKDAAYISAVTNTLMGGANLMGSIGGGSKTANAQTVKSTPALQKAAFANPYG